MDLLKRINKELKTEAEDILDVLKKLPNPEVLEKKEKQIEGLEKANLQVRLS